MSNQIFCNSNALLSLSLFSLFHFGLLAHLILSVWNVELKERNQEFDRSSLGLILCMLSFSKFYVYCARWMKTWRKPNTSRLAWLTCSGFFVWHLCRKNPGFKGQLCTFGRGRVLFHLERLRACMCVCGKRVIKYVFHIHLLLCFLFFVAFETDRLFLSQMNHLFLKTPLCVCVCVHARARA